MPATSQAELGQIRRLVRLAFLAAISMPVTGTSAYAQELPEGPGKALVQSACTECHGIDVIVRQRRAREDWTDVVSRMVGNGAQLSDEDYNQVIQYLAMYLGPAHPSASAKDHSIAAPQGQMRDK
jgi:mono/diheme cytochrome c family protein